MFAIDPSDLPLVIFELKARQGNLIQFLNYFAGDKPTEEKQRQQLLFEIRYAMKGHEDIESQWKVLLELQQETHVLIAEAKLLNILSGNNLAEDKPEKLLALLERLSPERWTKKTAVGKKKQKANPYEELLEE